MPDHVAARPAARRLRHILRLLSAAGSVALLAWLSACGHTPPDSPGALADFPMGVAVPADPWPNSVTGSPPRQKIVTGYFTAITPENAMKSAYLQPAPGEFRFAYADALVAFAERAGLLVHGHALVWHNQAPDWLNAYRGNADDFRALLDRHVTTVAAHYAGRVASWDVVNEAFDDATPTGYRHTIWYNNIGPGYIELAFQSARAAAPDADLYYNDYDISGALGPGKLNRILAMIDDFRARGVPIDGLGFQMHIDLEVPSVGDLRDALARAVASGVKIRISELDVSVNKEELLTTLTPTVAAQQRQRYADVVRTYLDVVPPAQRGGITVWGITDGDSWIRGFRQHGDWPLLFNEDFTPKPALSGVTDALRTAAH